MIKNKGHFALLLLAAVLPVTPLRNVTAATLALVGGRVIQGTGVEAIEDGVVIIQDSHIVAVGSASKTVIPRDANVVHVVGKTVMPGIIQGNGHVTFAGQGDHGRYWATRFPDLYGIGSRNLIDTLQQGVTSVRDTMGPLEVMLKLRHDVDSGAIAGARLFTCGTILNYGSLAPLLDEVDKPGTGVTHAQVEAARQAMNLPVLSAEDGRRIVREYKARGVDFIKVSALSDPGDSYSSLPPETLTAVIDEAHKQGLPTTTHAVGAPSVAASLDAGTDAIEHPAIAPSLDAPPEVTFISPQLAARMASQKVYGVSLLVTIEVYATYFKNPALLNDVQRMGNVPEGMLTEGQKFVKDSIANGAGPSLWEARYANTLKNMKTLIAAGVPIVMGTDSGTRLNYHQSANHVREMEILAGLGMTPLEVITAATLRGAQLLGHDRDLGSLEPGKLADVIVVDGNPLADIGALRHVEMVFKAGVRYR